MSVLIWTGDGDNDAISLGSLLNVFPAFAEISKLLEGKSGFDELQSVPGFSEQKVTKWWLDRVRQQARAFLQKYGEQITPRTRTVVDALLRE